MNEKLFEIVNEYDYFIIPDLIIKRIKIERVYKYITDNFNCNAVLVI